jgi:flagellar protein FlaJ
VNELKKTRLHGPGESVTWLKEPWLLAFRYLGARVQRVLPYFEDLSESLQKAGLKLSLQSYASMLIMLTGIGALASFLSVASIVGFAGSPLLLVFIFAIGISVMLGSLVFGVLYIIPGMLASSRRSKMDRELPFVASHMSILAAAGIPPTRVFKLLSDSVTTPEVASDSNEIVRDVEILGNDIMTAIETERQRSPSRAFAEMLEGLVATIRSGGNMKSYLLDSTRTIMDLRRIAAKQLIETLGAFAEVYVTLLIVFPLLIIVMFSVMALIGGGLGGISVTSMMVFVTYLIIPICGVAVIVMLDTMLGED